MPCFLTRSFQIKRRSFSFQHSARLGEHRVPFLRPQEQEMDQNAVQRQCSDKTSWGLTKAGLALLSLNEGISELWFPRTAHKIRAKRSMLAPLGATERLSGKCERAKSIWGMWVHQKVPGTVPEFVPDWRDPTEIWCIIFSHPSPVIYSSGRFSFLKRAQRHVSFHVLSQVRKLFSSDAARLHSFLTVPRVTAYLFRKALYRPASVHYMAEQRIHKWQIRSNCQMLQPERGVGRLAGCSAAQLLRTSQRKTEIGRNLPRPPGNFIRRSAASLGPCLKKSYKFWSWRGTTRIFSCNTLKLGHTKRIKKRERSDYVSVYQRIPPSNRRCIKQPWRRNLYWAN